MIWFDICCILSITSAKPILAFVFSVISYAIVYRGLESFTLLGAFAGAAFGLVLCKVFKLKPWSESHLEVLFTSISTVFLALQLDFIARQYLMTRLVFILTKFENAKVWAIESCVFIFLHFAWTYWNMWYPEYFTDFNRIYVLCVAPFFILLLLSGMEMIKARVK